MRNPAALILKSCIGILLLAGASQAQEIRQPGPVGNTGPVTIPAPGTGPTTDETRIALPGIAQPQQQPRVSDTGSFTVDDQTDIWGRRPQRTGPGSVSSNLPPPPPPPPGPVGCPGCIPPSVFAPGKIAVVDLGATIAGSAATARAKVLRDTSATTISVDVDGLSGGEGTQFLYVIARTGEVTKVGTVKIENGKARVSAQTQLDKFMIVVSPEDNLKVIGPTTKVSLTTGVPAGFTFSQGQNAAPDVSKSGGDKNVSFNVADSYSAPLLGIQGLGLDKETKLRMVFFDISEITGDAFITPRSAATTARVVIKLPKDTVPGTRFVLWAATPGRTYTRLGQAQARSQSDELIIEAETSLKDFGLLMTTETEEAPPLPGGRAVAVVAK